MPLKVLIKLTHFYFPTCKYLPNGPSKCHERLALELIILNIKNINPRIGFEENSNSIQNSYIFIKLEQLPYLPCMCEALDLILKGKKNLPFFLVCGDELKNSSGQRASGPECILYRQEAQTLFPHRPE